MSSFSHQIRLFGKQTQERLDLITQRLEWQSFSEIVQMSPVRTGAFRNSWNIGISNISMSTAPGGPDSATDRGLSALLTVKAGQVIYISNSLPYAMRLEFGHSRQAPSPPGIVRYVAARMASFKFQ